MTYFYEDDKGHVHASRSPTPPPGMKRRSGAALGDGKVLHSSIFATDNASRGGTYLADSGMTDAQREIARAAIAEVNARKQTSVGDAGGVLNLLDAGAGSQTLNDALGSCPKDTFELQRKVARSVIEARSATSDCAFDSAISNLRAAGRQYSTRGSMTADAAQRDALAAAAKAVLAYADGLQVQRGGSPAPVSDGASAYATHKRRIADAWKGAA